MKDPVEDGAKGQTRSPTQEPCRRCGALLSHCALTRGLFSRDEWYECGTCGYVCPGCKGVMVFAEKDTSSGIEYRSYWCRECHREISVERGIAMWEAYRQMNEESKNKS